MKTKTFLGLLLTIFLIVACKKERTCTCEWNYAINASDSSNYYFMNGSISEQSSTTTYKKISKRNAAENCRSRRLSSVSSYMNNSTPVTQTTTSTYNCELK